MAPGVERLACFFSAVHQLIDDLNRSVENHLRTPDELDHEFTLIADSRKEVIRVSQATLWWINQTLRMTHRRPFSFTNDRNTRIIYFDGCMIKRPNFFQISDFQGEYLVFIRFSFRISPLWYSRANPVITTLVMDMEIQLEL